MRGFEPYRGRSRNFAHPAEEEFASLFTELGYRWLYEPFTFPLTWTPRGKIKSAFSPDFYLRDLGLFIEVTLARNTTRKRKKIRACGALYPNMRIRLYTAVDYKRIIGQGLFDPEVDLAVES